MHVSAAIALPSLVGLGQALLAQTCSWSSIILVVLGRAFRLFRHADSPTAPSNTEAANDAPPLPSDPEPAPVQGSEDPSPTSPLPMAAEEAAAAAARRSMSRSPEPQGTGQLAYRAEPVRAATPPDPPLPPEPAASEYDAAVQVSSFPHLSGTPAAHVQMSRVNPAADGIRHQASIGRPFIQALVLEDEGSAYLPEEILHEQSVGSHSAWADPV